MNSFFFAVKFFLRKSHEVAPAYCWRANEMEDSDWLSFSSQLGSADHRLPRERRNDSFDYAKFNESGEATTKATPAQIETGRIQDTPNPGSGTRWLAVSSVRFHGGFGGPSPETTEPPR